MNRTEKILVGVLVTACFLPGVSFAGIIDGPCHGLLKSPAVIGNPFTHVYLLPGVVREIQAIHALGGGPAATAEKFYAWLSSNFPSLTDESEKKYVLDVFEISLPVVVNLAKVFDTTSSSFASTAGEATLKIARDSPVTRFRRSGKETHQLVARTIFGDEFFAREKSHADRLHRMTARVSNPETWKDLITSIEYIQNQVDAGHVVANSVVAQVFGGALLKAMDQATALRVELAQFANESALLQKQRPEVLNEALSLQSKASTPDDASEFDESVARLDGMSMSMNMNETLVELGFNFLESLELALNSTRGLNHVDYGSRGLSASDIRYTALVDLLNLLKKGTTVK